jgi:hypothetical protein
VKLTTPLLIAALVAGLSGCAATVPSGVDPTAASDPVGAMEKVDGVVAVDANDDSASVTVSATASDDEVQDAATAIRKIADVADWAGSIVLTREQTDSYDEEQDVLLPIPWEVTVYPGDRSAIHDLLEVTLVVEKIPGVGRFGLGPDGWPYVTVLSIDTFADVFHQLSQTATFAHGGTYSLFSDKHLQIVHIPARSSDESIEAIVQLAIDYPDAEILLQATTAGPQWPTLYVARLTPEQVKAIEARLLDPALADADIEGYPVPFILTTVGADGPVYTEGNFGGVAG